MNFRPYPRLFLTLFLCITLAHPHISVAQGFIGMDHDANVITNEYYNPAFAISDDPYQVNALSVSAVAGNNAYFIPKADVNNYYKINSTNARAFWMNTDILGPGVSFKVKKRYSFAVTTRTRFLVNVDNFNNQTFKLINNYNPDTSIKYKVDNFSMSTQLFSELNFAYSGYIIQNGDYTLEAGAAVKVLMGIGAVGIGIPQGNFHAYADNTINHVHGTANIAFTPYANEWLSIGQPNAALQNGLNNTSLGLDLGAVYVYAPSNNVRETKEGYTFRLAVSITDIGSINYKASSTTGSYTVNVDTFNAATLNKSSDRTYGQSIEQYVTDSIARQTSKKSTFKVGLPTALRINADLKIASGLTYNAYVSGNLLINLRSPSPDKYVSHYITTFNVTPRVMFYKQFGFGIPFTFNEYKQGFLGLVLYAGPFFIGSGSVGNYLVLQNITGLDAYAGLSFRIKGRTKERGVDY